MAIGQLLDLFATGKPSATMSVSLLAVRPAGRRTRSPTGFEMSYFRGLERRIKSATPIVESTSPLTRFRSSIGRLQAAE